MKKLGIAIKSTLMGSGEPFKANPGPWSSKVVDIRDVLRHVPTLGSDPKRAVIFFSFSEAGAYITVARGIQGRPNDNVAGWIFIPSDLMISGEETVSVLETLKELIFRPEFPGQDYLDRAFSKEYPLKPASLAYKPSPKNGKFGRRNVTPDRPLSMLLGSSLYQTYYSAFQDIILEQFPGEVVDADDLNGKPLQRLVSVLPPTPGELKGGVELFLSHNGEPFNKPVMLQLGSVISIRAERRGFESKEFNCKVENDGMYCPLPKIDWQKKVSPSDFRVVNAAGARVTSGCRIFINGQPLTAPRYMGESELANARVRVVCDSEDRTMEADLTRLPLTISFEVTGAAGKAASGANSGMPSGSPDDGSWRMKLKNGKIGKLTADRKYMRGAESPVEGFKADGRLLLYSPMKERLIGFVAGLIVGGLVIGILAICGAFSSKTETPKDDGNMNPGIENVNEGIDGEAQNPEETIDVPRNEVTNPETSPLSTPSEQQPQPPSNIPTDNPSNVNTEPAPGNNGGNTTRSSQEAFRNPPLRHSASGTSPGNTIGNSATTSITSEPSPSTTSGGNNGTRNEY